MLHDDRELSNQIQMKRWPETHRFTVEATLVMFKPLFASSSLHSRQIVPTPERNGVPEIEGESSNPYSHNDSSDHEEAWAPISLYDYAVGELPITGKTLPRDAVLGVMLPDWLREFGSITLALIGARCLRAAGVSAALTLPLCVNYSMTLSYESNLGIGRFRLPSLRSVLKESQNRTKSDTGLYERLRSERRFCASKGGCHDFRRVTLFILKTKIRKM